MAELVVLSDSDVSITSIPNDKVADIDEDDFQFPEVQFHVPDVDLSVVHDSPNRNHVPNISPLKSNRICSPSSSAGTANSQSRKRNVQASSHSTSDSPEPDIEVIAKHRGRKATQVDKAKKKKPKSQLTEERLKRQEQLARDKALKAITAKNSKNIKPGECMKFMEVVLDIGLEQFSFKDKILTALLDDNVRYSIREEIIPNSITWKRTIENSYVNEANEISTITDTEKVNQILIIWNWDVGVTKVSDNSFCATISNIKATLPNYNLMLVIYGIENYFTYKKQAKGSDKNGENTQKTKRKNSEFKNYPEISRQQLESCLNEIQITAKCSSRLINTSEELSLMVYQCTKAIAEIPYKAEKNKSLTSKFDWYVMGDNRNCVRVDKDGNGLKRLWQQQLCQFNLSSLEIAEAICSMYRCPADLMEAYNNCTQTEGMNLLRDIPIRRAIGPLTTSRKVGPELSKKVYIMFTSEDGETLLS